MTRSLAPRSRIALRDLIACQMGALEAAARAILGRIALNRVILRSRERPGDADLVAPQRRRRICPTSLSMPPDLPQWRARQPPPSNGARREHRSNGIHRQETELCGETFRLVAGKRIIRALRPRERCCARSWLRLKRLATRGQCFVCVSTQT